MVFSTIYWLRILDLPLRGKFSYSTIGDFFKIAERKNTHYHHRHKPFSSAQWKWKAHEIKWTLLYRLNYEIMQMISTIGKLAIQTHSNIYGKLPK